MTRRPAELLARLRQGPRVVLDGGLGTMLLARGLSPGTPPELWNLERPADVVVVHRAYVKAGSEAVQTNSFGGHPLRLARYGLEARCAELNAAAVRLARSSGARFVIGDVGPVGELLPPVGAGDAEAFRHGFEAQCLALAAAGADGLHIETMSDLREALLALEAARAAAPALPVIASLTFERKKRGFFTAMGNPLGASLRALAEAGAAAVGANCSLASADMAALAHEALPLGLPLVVQPNAGSPLSADGPVGYRQSPGDFARDLAPLVPNLAAVGGCCGTDPRFIASLRLAERAA